MFDKKYEERLSLWRKFRDSLENDPNPLNSVLDFYNLAPKVSMHTDPWTKEMWPDPWQLIYENQYCDFCRVLGMCYSLQLTERFKGSTFEIHISIDRENAQTFYLLRIDNMIIGYDNIPTEINQLPQTIQPQKIYNMPAVQ